LTHVPEAIENTVAIAEQCNLEIPLKDYIFPHFDHPGTENNEELFERLSREGLQIRINKLIKNDPEFNKDRIIIYNKRLENEIKMIKKMNFTTYFLIVSDFINYSKKIIYR